MASTKFVNHKYNDRTAMRRLVKYVTEQTDSGLISTNCGTTDPVEAVNRMIDTKCHWNKTDGNQLFHIVLSLAPEESKSVSPYLMLSFGQRFAKQMFPGHEVILAVHNKKNLHVHLVVNSVNLDNGRKFSSRRDTLEKARCVTDALCKEYNLKINQKGRHYDGTRIETGSVTSYDKATYEQAKKKNSWLMDIFRTVRTASVKSCSYDEYISKLSEFGIRISETKAHLTYIDSEGHRVRDSRLSNTFHLNVSREGLEKTFEENRTRSKEQTSEKVYSIQLHRFYYIECQERLIRLARSCNSFYWYNDDPKNQIVTVMATSLDLILLMMELILNICELANIKQQHMINLDKAQTDCYIL